MSKSSSGKSTTYYAINGKYVGEKTVVNGTTYYISYYYDENGAPMGLNVNGSAYFFVKNLQGDVTAIMSYQGTVVARYTYDAWGKLLSVRDGNNANVTSATHIANLNPFRYRGYIYDTETGLYYVSSRYYDAEVGRFLNADQYISTGQGVLGFNMFAYCGNNPVMHKDSNGNSAEVAIPIWEYAKDILAAAGAVAAGAVGSAGVALGLGVLAVGILAYQIHDAFTISSEVSVTIPSSVAPTPAARSEENEPSKSIPIPDSIADSTTKTREDSKEGNTYYHITTPENAAAIMLSNSMFGSSWEAGFIFAWKHKPSKYAIDNSGANKGVIISFKTGASFVKDTGITDPKVIIYEPVVSARPGPIVVWDVTIVG